MRAVSGRPLHVRSRAVVARSSSVESDPDYAGALAKRVAVRVAQSVSFNLALVLAQRGPECLAHRRTHRGCKPELLRSFVPSGVLLPGRKRHADDLWSWVLLQ